MNQPSPPPESPRRPFIGSRYSVALVVFAGIAVYFFFSEHRSHLLSALAFLFVLACPLMHRFMHHGHSHHRQMDDSNVR